MQDSLSGIILPLVGFLFICLVIYLGMAHVAKGKRFQLNRLKQEAETARKKEKYLLALAIANELGENRLKSETFITIYTELLRDLRDFERRASYEDTGDFIHRHPPLERAVFEENRERLVFLGLKTAESIAKIYENIHSGPEYLTLEAGMPRGQALLLVEKVLDDAQKIIDPIEPVIAGLNVIIRDGEKNF